MWRFPKVSRRNLDTGQRTASTTSNTFLERFLATYGGYIPCDMAEYGNLHPWQNSKTSSCAGIVAGEMKTLGCLSLRYKDQPDVGYSCGKPGHQKWDCDGSGVKKQQLQNVMELLRRWEINETRLWMSRMGKRQGGFALGTRVNQRPVPLLTSS